jgi:multidrug resistance efflux pump
MRAAEETLNLELKEAEASVKAAEKKGSDLEQQLSEIENKLVASSEQKMKIIN